MSRVRRRIAPTVPFAFPPETLCLKLIGGVWGKAASGTPDQPLLLVGCHFTEIDPPVTTFPGAKDPGLRHCCFALRIYDAIGQTRLLPLQERI
ncbi:hypothetical protein BDM02DRAFT_3188969 [Thelephora ganbajun]|uniref:Uncharacterized protein n=1 Tax=Thelephora ganbajun TaxID=370292 RepID=A0ACB6Z9B2_THEGA|nr:hypothetical protein BDM02DRAFT_3188969 [Thelephora ganbajun]